MIKCPDQEDIEEVKTQIIRTVGDYEPEKFGLSYLKAKLDASEEVIIEALEALVEDGKLVQKEFGSSGEPLYRRVKER